MTVRLAHESSIWVVEKKHTKTVLIFFSFYLLFFVVLPFLKRTATILSAEAG